MSDDELIALLPPGSGGAHIDVPDVGTVRRRGPYTDAMCSTIWWGEVWLDTGVSRILREGESAQFPDARFPRLREEFERTGRIRQQNAANRIPAEAVAAPLEWLAEQERRADIVRALGWTHTGRCWVHK